jgi:threonine/homoserine/homoserine lactone efflux protein
MNSLLEGALLGLSLAFLFGFGPAFFALIQTAIQRGFWPAVLLALGIFINDAFIVTLSLMGSSQLFHATDNYKIIGIIGGSLLIIFGLYNINTKPASQNKEQNLVKNSPHPLIYIGKGFLLNIANPFVWIFWISLVVGVTARFKAETTQIFTFFASALIVVFLSDIVKSFAASQFKKFATPSVILFIHRIAAIGLIAFGVFLIIRAVVGF